MEPRELALREVSESPWLQQRELAARLSQETGLAESTLIRLFRRMEAEGELQSGLDGRRKTYALAEPEAEPGREPTPGALWSSRLAPLGEPEPEPEEEEAEPAPRPLREEPEAEPEPPPPPPDYVRPAWPFAAVVALVVAAALLAALLLSPDKRDPLTGAERDQQETRAASASPEPDPEPDPEPAPSRPEPAKAAAAKEVPVAVLSGVPEAGAAAEEARRLKRLGYRVRAVSNAPGPAERSSVLYTRGERAAARSLADEAGIRSVAAAGSEVADAARGAGLVVVVGPAR